MIGQCAECEGYQDQVDRLQVRAEAAEAEANALNARVAATYVPSDVLQLRLANQREAARRAWADWQAKVDALLEKCELYQLQIDRLSAAYAWAERAADDAVDRAERAEAVADGLRRQLDEAEHLIETLERAAR